MIGLPVPIVSISGSGNHGIANLLGVTALAESLEATKLQFARALALSSAITVYIKSHMTKITQICGCSIAASTGVAAAAVYLLGGSVEQIKNAMDMVMGSLLGVLCDGAKETCAYKISIAVGAAIEYGYYATQGVSIPRSVSVIAKTTEGTVANLGVINNIGMAKMTEHIVKMIQAAKS
jgi:L-cysteine desulfidase